MFCPHALVGRDGGPSLTYIANAEYLARHCGLTVQELRTLVKQLERSATVQRLAMEERCACDARAAGVHIPCFSCRGMPTRAAHNTAHVHNCYTIPTTRGQLMRLMLICCLTPSTPIKPAGPATTPARTWCTTSPTACLPCGSNRACARVQPLRQGCLLPRTGCFPAMDDGEGLPGCLCLAGHGRPLEGGLPDQDNGRRLC